MKTKLEEALEKIDPMLPRCDRVRLKLEVLKRMNVSKVEKLETDLFNLRLNIRIENDRIDRILEINKRGGFISISQHAKFEIKSEFTALEELILEDISFFPYLEEPPKVLKGEALYRVQENGIIVFLKSNYDSTDSGRYNEF